MQGADKQEMIDLGAALRALIEEHTKATGTTYRHLDRAIGKRPNYITSYLGVDPTVWTIPKHPAYGKLLQELGVTEAELKTRSIELANGSTK